MPNRYPLAERGPCPGNNGVPLGHQSGDESLGPMFSTDTQIDSELLAPMGRFPRRQFIRSGYFMLNPAEATLYEAPPWFYMGPNLIGRRTTQAGSGSRIANLTNEAGVGLSNG